MPAHHPSREEIRLEDVLGALSSPIRLAVLQVIADQQEHPCSSVLPQVSKSTMTHHYRILREAGIARQSHVGRSYTLTLRRDDLDSRFPGLLDAILQPLARDSLTSRAVAQYREIVPGA